MSDANTQDLVQRLRFTWADNGAGHMTDFTADMHAAADRIEQLEAAIVQWYVCHEIDTQADDEAITDSERALEALARAEGGRDE